MWVCVCVDMCAGVAKKDNQEWRNLPLNDRLSHSLVKGLDKYIVDDTEEARQLMTPLKVCVCVCASVCVRMCVRVCVLSLCRGPLFLYTDVYIYTHINTYIILFICACVCVASLSRVPLWTV